MASAHIIFGNVKKGHPVLDANFASETVASGATSNASPSQYNFVNVTAVGGDVYVAFSTETPNAGQNPRALVVEGASLSLSISAHTKIAVLDASS